MKQVVDLRLRAPLTFGSDDDAARWAEQVLELRASMTSEYAVAPRCQLHVVGRGLLHAGAAISPDEVLTVDGARDWQRWRSLIDRGVIIARGDAT